MNRSRWLCCAATLLLFSAMPVAQALADEGDGRHVDPVAIRDHCIQKITRIATACVSQNQMSAAQCVQRIRQLLANGHDAQARHVARHWVGSINAKSHAAADRIHKVCAHCIHTLRHLGTPALAQQIHQACADRVDRVRRSRQAALNAIANALGGGQPDNQT